MQIVSHRRLAREFKRISLSEDGLAEAIAHAIRAVSYDPLGKKHLVKLRIARPGRGQSSGFRAAVFLKPGEMAVVLGVHSKKERENFSLVEIERFKRQADDLEGASLQDIDRQIASGQWTKLAVIAKMPDLLYEVDTPYRRAA